MKTKLLLFIPLSLLFPFLLRAQSSIHAIDQLLTSYNKKGQFDGSILIAKGSEVTIFKQYGLANRQFNVPITETTKFPVASITKLYTAILVLKLQEEGKLNIDSPLATYLPDLLPKSGKLITLKQLLVHVSGLPREKVSAYEFYYNIKDFIKNNIADTLINKPGSKYAYNNVNYILLGAVIERVSQKAWADVLAEKIVSPAGLLNTGVIKTDSVINNLAYGYHNYSFGRLPARPLRNDGPIYMENYATAGAIFTTPQDLFKLYLALTNNKILTEASKKLMYSPEKAIGKVDKDLFVTLGSYSGTKKLNGLNKPVSVIGRTGNINGFNATFIQLPDTNEVVIICCNTDAGNLYKIEDEVLELLESPQ